MQYFLDWESQVGMLFRGTHPDAQLVCQTLTSSIFGFCANWPFEGVVVPVEGDSL